ncbi:amidase [Ketogulonicigenium vulgare]|nr:amidase [Ketogulonicigenium vulgare]
MNIVKSDFAPRRRADPQQLGPGPTDLSLADAARAMTAGALDARTLVQATLTRLEQTESHIHAYLRHDADAALAAAEASDKRRKAGAARGPLDGVPFAVKDNMDALGFATTAASRVPQPPVTADSAIVARLRAAGAILIGKANTWEYGTGNSAVSFDLPTPPARNPWNPAHYTGGSSSGSAAAVAAGSASFSIGTDSGGSVRLPAAGCGIVGLKPTFGRISRAGIMPNCWSFDTPGPMTWTVEDAAIVYDAIAGHDAADPVSLTTDFIRTAAGLNQSIAGLRVGLIGALDDHAPSSPEISGALAKAADMLRALGATVQPLKMPLPPSRYREVATPINWSESFSIHESDYLMHRDLMGAALREKLETGMYMRAADYLAALRERRRLVIATDALFGTVDLLLLPMTPFAAPQITDDARVRAFTTASAGSPFSLTGHPALSLPVGAAPDGLPLAVQLAAGFHQEHLLLRAAHQLEQTMLQNEGKGSTHV